MSLYHEKSVMWMILSDTTIVFGFYSFWIVYHIFMENGIIQYRILRAGLWNSQSQLFLFPFYSI